MTRKIAVLVGSLRKESFSRKIAKNIEALAPAGLTFEEIDISKVGHYNQDLDGNPPAEWVELRDKIKSADAVLFVTPEYNRSVPGVLKNAIDIASRPYGHSAFNGKPAAVVSNSPGNIGGFGAHHHLRQTLAFLNMPKALARMTRTKRCKRKGRTPIKPRPAPCSTPPCHPLSSHPAR